MNVVDIAIIIILLASSAVGLLRGFIREVLSLGAWVVALWVAYTYAITGAVYLQAYIAAPPLRMVAAFIIFFVLALIAASLLGHLLCRLFAVGGIGGVDRSLGLLFGAARGVIIIALLMLAAVIINITAQAWWQQSVLVNYFAPAADLLRELMPPDLAVYFTPKARLI